LLIQGDTLKTLFDDMKELLEEVEKSDIESIKGISENVQGRLVDLLSQYEKALEADGHELPYIGSVRSVRMFFLLPYRELMIGIHILCISQYSY